MTRLQMQDIRNAATRLAGRIVSTPLLSSPQLDAIAGAKVLVKAENLQLTGAFKIRGALNKIITLPVDQRQHGVVTFSAGNHGQAVAAAAKQAGCPAVIVLPANAPRIKIDNCRWWGAEVVLYDPLTEDRSEVAQQFIDQRGMALIHPFDDPDIMAGQGTAGLELSAQAAEQGHTIDAIAVACSGGGLASGVITAVTHAFPNATGYVVEPAGGDKMRRSLQSGKAERNPAGRQTIMDALNGPTAGTTTLHTLQQLPVTPLSVDDDAALHAIAMAYRYLKIVVEPGGAAALAAVLRHPELFRGKTVAVVCSGGNVDAAVFTRALDAHA